MLVTKTEVDRGRSLRGLLDGVDSVTVILRSVLAGETPIVAVQQSKSARRQLLDQLIPALHRANYRVIQAMNSGGTLLDLNSFMDQVVGHVCVDAIERLELCHAALTDPGPGPTILVVDDAHLLADQVFRYLDLVMSLDQHALSSPQIMLAGSPDIWKCLPSTGSLAEDKVALRIAVPDDVGALEHAADDLTDRSLVAIETEVAADPITAGPVAVDSPIGENAMAAEAASSRELPVIEEHTAVDNDTTSEAAAAKAQDDVIAPDIKTSPEPVVARPRDSVTNADVSPQGIQEAVPRMVGDSPVLHKPERPIPPGIWSTQPKRRWPALAMGVGVIVVCGGLTADGLWRTRSHLMRAFDQTRPVPAVNKPSNMKQLTDSAASIEAEDRSARQTTTSTTTVAAAEVDGQPAAASLASRSTVALPAEVSAIASRRDARPSDTVNPSPRAETDALGQSSPPAQGRVDPTAVSTPDRVPDNTALFQALPPAQVNAPANPNWKIGDASANPALPSAEPMAREPRPVEPTTVIPPSIVAAQNSAATARPAATEAQSAVVASHPSAASGIASSPVSSNVVTLLISRGDTLLASGDIAAARLMYQRAAGANSARGAVAMGKTYDLQFLDQMGARGLVAEPQRAAFWYQRAADLGDPEGTKLLAKLRGK